LAALFFAEEKMMSGQKPDSGAFLARSRDDVGQGVFVPEHYGFTERAALLQYIAAHPLAQIFSAAGGDLRATATPLIHIADGADKSGLTFIGHIAKRNPHGAAITAGAAALALFVGPGAYISPRWFVHNKTVPTWSYVSVQLRGRLEPITDIDAVMAVLSKTVDHLEAEEHIGSDDMPWSLAEASTDLVERLRQGITAFYFRGESIEGVRRLNQDKDIVDMRSIMAGLAKSPQQDAYLIAEMMAQNIAAASGDELD
jgi:transcriptional regulator